MDSTLRTPNRSLDIRYKAAQVCNDYLGGAWSTISPSQISLMPISGAMSNQIFCCSLPDQTMVIDDEPARVLLRLYGSHWHGCDMSPQVEIFNLLSMKDLGPRLYGDFEDGRLEEFLEAVPLTTQEMLNQEVSSMIARKLANIHSLDVPIDREKIWLIERLHEWLGNIMESEGTFAISPTMRPTTIEIARELLSINLEDEILFLSKILDQNNSPIAFSHNDLHPGNILVTECSKRRPTLYDRLVFIDFEYCSYNYRAYDIANHFCEWYFENDTPNYPHFEFFQDRFPSEENQRSFIQSYLKETKRISSIRQTDLRTENCCQPVRNGRSNTNLSERNGTANNHNKNGFSKSSSINGTIRSREVDEFLCELKPFFAAANLLWTVWCIKSALTSNIKFGYWESAMTRWKLYLHFKEKLLKN